MLTIQVYYKNSLIQVELKKLNTTKRDTFKNIPTKLLKLSNDICCEPLFNIMNNGINSSVFHNELKSVDVTPFFKSVDFTDKKSFDLLVFFPSYLNFLKVLSKSNLEVILIIFLVLIFTDIVKVSMSNMLFSRF